MMFHLHARYATILLATILLTGCGQSAPPGEADSGHGHREAPPPTNRIGVPENVRRNLGILFARVESRAVARTIRIPGRFELMPEARREYRTMLGGRVELHVTQYQQVKPGDLLYTLDSPAWRELQERLNATEAQIQQARARVDNIDPLFEAHERHHHELEEAVAIWTERVQQLEQMRSSGAVTAEEFAQARAILARTRAELAEVMEKEAELRSRQIEVQAELGSARERLEILLMNASTLVGVEPDELTAVDEQSVQRHPRWREIRSVQVRAASPGVVETIAVTNGSWAMETSLVLTTVQPELVRFRARGLQADLGRLRDGLASTIVPPAGGSIQPSDTMPGTLRLGIGGDPDERTVELLVAPGRLSSWARPGVAAHLEIVTEGGGDIELAIPAPAVIQDGLETVFFRRDPGNLDEVIRVEADLGVNDGRWVVVYSGVKEGDEVVVDGVYQLMLATSGVAPTGGHFHPDGTFHQGRD